MRDSLPVLAVFGGSFDPPHLGHAMMPSYLLAAGHAERVLVAPCFAHALGKKMRPFLERVAMTRAAMAGYGSGRGARVEVSDVEARIFAANGGAPSYTLDLLETVQKSHTEWRIRLVIGSDIVESGETEKWHRWSEIDSRFDPIIVPRAGFSAPNEVLLPDVSSSRIRALLRSGIEGESMGAASGYAELRRLLPAAVIPRLTASRPRKRILLVGRGHAFSNVERWLSSRGFEPRGIGGRGVVDGSEGLPDQIETYMGVWLLCADPHLPEVARALVGQRGQGLPPGMPVLHAAGALIAADSLAGLAAAGHPVGTMHPICSLRSERDSDDLMQAGFGVEGAPRARELALELLGPQPWIDLQGCDAMQRQRYHGACALLANHLAVLWDAATQLLGEFGSQVGGRGTDRHGDHQAVLGTLLRSSMDNLLQLGIPAGVTGPLARGNRTAVAAHLEALSAVAGGREYIDLYRVLSERLERLLSRTA